MPKRLFPNRRNGTFFFQLRFLNCAFKKTFQIKFHRGITLFHSFLLACFLIIISSETEHFEIESILVNETLSLTDRVSSRKRIRKIFVHGMQNTGENFCLWNPEYSSGNSILSKIEIQNPCSTEKEWNQESTTCNLESKTVLDSLTWDEMEALVSRTIVKLLVEQSRFSTRLIYIDHRQLVSRT